MKKMKKLLAFALVLVMLIGMMPTTASARPGGGNGGNDADVDYTVVSTVTFRIVNGTWSESLALAYSDANGDGINDVSINAERTEVTFQVYYCEDVGYVYECEGPMEAMLIAILGVDGTFGSTYIVPDTGYILDGEHVEWTVNEDGGIVVSESDEEMTANEQMTHISDNIHDFDDNRTPEGGFLPNTVYELVLTKDVYYVTGTIDNGTVTNASQEIKDYNGLSEAMVFTPATGYSITGVTVNGTPVSFTVDSNGVYTYPAQNVIYDIAVVVTTTLNTYTVTWVNYDDTQLEKDENVPYGSTPEYNGDTPVKPDDAQYKYVFAGWTPEISPVTGDITYKAVFKEASTRTYTVTWVNHNKDILEEDTNVAYGTAVNYDGKAGEGSVTYGGATPTKASDSHYTYEFSGWELYEGTYTNHKTGIVGNTTFIAVFTAKPIPRAATVEVILNGTVDPTNETVTGGEHKNISDMVSGADDDIYLRLVDGTGDYIKLVNEDEEGNITTGVYTNPDVANGDYGIYVKIGTNYVRVDTQILTINNADRTRYLPYYSVTYDANKPADATAEVKNVPAAEYYYIGSHVDVSDEVPSLEGYIFLGWMEDNNTYQPSTALETVHLDTSITKAHTLVAQWEAAATIKVTVVVDHNDRNLNDVAEDLTVVLTSSTDSTNYNEVDGTARTFEADEWTESTADNISTYGTVTYTGYPTTGLSYSADAAIAGYKHVKTEVEPNGNTYNVTVYLEYDPAGFELKFDVLVDASIPVSIQPDEVDVKVTYWDGDSWEPISDHVNHSVAVAIDLTENGLTEDGKYYKGTGTVHVPAFSNNEDKTPFLYRIELVRLDFGNYQLAMTGSDDVNYSSSKFYFFPAGCFTGTVEVGKDCEKGLSEDGGLYGSHAYLADATKPNVYTQHDSITAYITAKTYNIELDLNYDNGEASDIFAKEAERLTVPALDAYGTPTRDGFTFAGWYTLDGTDGNWGTQISGGEYIHEYVEALPGTLTLYAKWNENFDVAGTVYIDMGYPCTDVSRTVTVALQWRAANGTVYVTQRSQTITLDPGTDGDRIASGTYLFKDVANIGEYRIYVIAPNGGTITYQNEPNSVSEPTAYTEYTASDYVVVDEDADGTAYVNIFMDAMDFDLGYMVDASAIGEGFRPTDVIMDLRHDHRSGNSVSYEVIEDELTTTVAAATGLSAIGKIAVPPYHANGYLYDYVISVLRYKGADGSADEWNRYFHYSTTEGYIERPFSVRYTGPANYSETANNDGLYQDVTLKAIFVPKTYTVNYNLDGGSWPSADYHPVRVHTWSFETPITAVPVKEGYVFEGWAVEDPAKAYTYEDGSIPASVWEDVYLIALWARDIIVDPDEEDPDPDKPGDGVPDKYQVVIKYVAGQGGAVAPTEEVITMRVDNKLVTTMDITVAGSVATPAEDYVFDGWSHDYDNAELDVTKAATGEFTITNAVGNSTYTFTASFADDKKGNPGEEDESDGIADKYQVFVEFKSANETQGTVTDENAESPDNDATGIYQTYTFADKATSGDVTPVLTNVLVTPAQNYAFDIWTRDTSNAPVLPTKTLKDVPGGTTVVFWAHFAEDTIVDPDKDPDPDKPGDGIPDKYQAVVTYKVVNGSWSDGTDTDIQAVFTLYNYDADHGYWVAVIPVPTLDDTVPTGMTPDDGYSASSGAWNDGLTEEELKETHPSNGAVYTYTFDEKEIIIVVPTGSVSLIKVDSADDTILLADVVFKLYSASGAYIGTYTTDANGTILVTGLPVGDYYWEETRPAQGYELGGEKIHFTVVANKTVTVTVKNTRSDIPGVFTDDHYAYIIGYPDGMVHPEGNITRAEVATIFFRLLSDATRAQYMTKTNSFADVNEGDWFNTAVSTMAAMGIVNGYPDGNFYPNDYITRAEFAAIAARFDTNGNTSDADFSDVYGHWAEDEIFISANNGWILGYPDGSFDPDKNISRAEAMAVVNRVLQRIPRSADDLLDDMVVWPDNMNVNAWYYLAVQEATNSHEYSRYPDMTEHWTALREVPDWTIYEK